MHSIILQSRSASCAFALTPFVLIRGARFPIPSQVRPCPKPSPSRSAPTRSFPPRSPSPIPRSPRAIELELGRQRDEIELIASENIVSKAVLEAQGSVMTNKYAEGYPGRRYYGGCQFVDIAETLAIERACKLFGCRFANVQPQFRQPGQPGRVPGADAAGRHVHGARPRRRRPSDPRLAGQHVGASGSSRSPTASTARRSASTWTSVARLAREHKPKLIIAGGSAYARHWDFAALPRDRRRGRRLFRGRHGPFRRAGGGRRASRRRSRTPTSSPPRPTRRCAARAAA